MSKWIEQIRVPVYVFPAIADAAQAETIEVTVFIHSVDSFNRSHTQTQGEANQVTAAGSFIFWTSDRAKDGLNGVVLHTTSRDMKYSWCNTERASQALFHFGFLSKQQMLASIKHHKTLRAELHRAERIRDKQNVIVDMLRDLDVEQGKAAIRRAFPDGLRLGPAPKVKIPVVSDEEMEEIRAAEKPKRTKVKPKAQKGVIQKASKTKASYRGGMAVWPSPPKDPSKTKIGELEHAPKETATDWPAPSPTIDPSEFGV